MPEPFQYSNKAIDLWKEKGYDYLASSWNEIHSGNFFENVIILIVRLSCYVDSSILKKNAKFKIFNNRYYRS